MKVRMPVAVAAALVVAALATACAPNPSPPASPTPTFSSEAEAFAAAEATYRAYVDALNHVDLSDPKTFEAVYQWTTGDANAAARKSFSQMHADDWSLSGDTKFDHLRVEQITGSKITAELCLDVTDVDVFDRTGASVVPADRADRQPLRVNFSSNTNSTGLAISSSEASDGPSCG